MKKIFTLSLALILCIPAFADSLRIFRCSKDGIPGISEPQLLGFSISANGQYVCGTIEQGSGLFIGNSLTGEVKWIADGNNSSELRGVDDFGEAIGFIDDNGAFYSFDTGETSFITPPTGIRYVQGEGISNDGSVKVGSFIMQSFNMQAGYCTGVEGWKPLPYPSESELGNFLQNINSFSAAKFVSADGSVVCGCLGSFSVPIVWTRIESGEYVPDFFPNRFVKTVEEDRNDDSKPLYAISGMYFCMSNNGRYVASIGAIANDDNTATRPVPVVYDTWNKTLKIYSEPQQIDEFGVGLYARAISDDGTFVGTIDQPSTPQGNMGSFIMWAGEEQARLYVDEFPAFNEIFGDSDLYGQNVPTGISADGKHILGFAYYSDDFDINSDDPAYWLTYVLSLEDTGVGQMAQPMGSQDTVYSIDGRRINRLQKGLNIVRKANGSVVKTVR